MNKLYHFNLSISIWFLIKVKDKNKGTKKKKVKKATLIKSVALILLFRKFNRL
jgi:CRISPR/Cas system CSM-associated protein Csm4 (group 5 of RAMP superfamily)